MFSACKAIQLLSVSFCVVRAVHKFDFRLVIKASLINSNQWEEVHEVTGTCDFDRICIFVSQSSVLVFRYFNILKTNRRLLYLKTQFVPRSKHVSSRL